MIKPRFSGYYTSKMRQKNEIGIEANQFRFLTRQFSTGALPQLGAIPVGRKC
jgi:hypothetical protein